ncbi:MAG: hypothetical protein ABIJ26_01270 [Candidatus Margulisiibacteriota bacterium]|nr:hypothetical protein [Candidatus Margulisiibacteriota bacterium]
MDKEITNIDRLEEALKRFWKDYDQNSRPIKGVHTEVVVEPKFFLGGKLNPQVRDLLITVYLSSCTREDVEKGKITIQNGTLLIKDKYGKPMATIRKQRIIREFMQRISQ